MFFVNIIDANLFLLESIFLSYAIQFIRRSLRGLKNYLFFNLLTQILFQSCKFVALFN